MTSSLPSQNSPYTRHFPCHILHCLLVPWLKTPPPNSHCSILLLLCTAKIPVNSWAEASASNPKIPGLFQCVDKWLWRFPFPSMTALCWCCQRGLVDGKRLLMDAARELLSKQKHSQTRSGGIQGPELCSLHGMAAPKTMPPQPLAPPLPPSSPLSKPLPGVLEN